MPELPDVDAYVHALQLRILGKPLLGAHIFSFFALKTVEPKLADLHGLEVTGLNRLGKRVVIEFERELYCVIHLMIAGRLAWKDGPPKSGKAMGKLLLARWDFDGGSLSLVEFGSKKRASIHIVSGASALRSLDPGGIEPLTCTFEEFRQALQSQNRTLKRMLTSPKVFAGIGNAYSDEILHAARISPVRLTQSLSDSECRSLLAATQTVLTAWRERLVGEAAIRFPDPASVTAFRPEFAAHGKFGEPCPDCGAPIQRIRYADNETNYCARCQNEGRLLADRSLSRLLKSDWPRTVEELVAE